MALTDNFENLWMSSVGAFLASLALPGLHFSEDDPVFGITLLLLGWWGILTFDGFAWLANVLYFISLLCLRRQKFTKAFWLSLLCIPTAMLSYRAEAWYFNEARGTPITELGMAFYVWVASFILLSIALWGRPSTEMKQ